jgi:hypothetical protein
VPNGGRDDVLVILESVILAFEPAQSPRDIGCDAGLFGNNESLGHQSKGNAALGKPDEVFSGQLFDQLPEFESE